MGLVAFLTSDATYNHVCIHTQAMGDKKATNPMGSAADNEEEEEDEEEEEAEAATREWSQRVAQGWANASAISLKTGAGKWVGGLVGHKFSVKLKICADKSGKVLLSIVLL